MFSVRPLVAAVLGVLLLPVAGRADILFTPFVGGNLGGSVTSRFADFVGDQSRTTFGGSVATMSGGIFGVEGDLGRQSSSEPMWNSVVYPSAWRRTTC